VNEVESYQIPLPKLRPPRACSRVNEVACYTRATKSGDFSVLVLVSDEVLKKIPRRRKKPFSPTSKLVGVSAESTQWPGDASCRLKRYSFFVLPCLTKPFNQVQHTKPPGFHPQILRKSQSSRCIERVSRYRANQDRTARIERQGSMISARFAIDVAALDFSVFHVA